MFDSLRSRMLLALGVAVVVTLAVIATIASVTRPETKAGPGAAAVWKARTGVDLDALPNLHPAYPDSEEARALDALVAPLGLHLGGRYPERQQEGEPDEAMYNAIGALREDLRAAIRATTTDPKPFTPMSISFLEKKAATLDAVADYVAKHDAIRWRHDFEPRQRSSALYTTDHLTLHRFLIGRAFIALERNDAATALRMLSASQKLNALLEQRQELDAQFISVGAERLQLALLRRAGSALNVAPEPAMERLRERYLDGMSAEAKLILTGAARSPLDDRGKRPVDDTIMRVLVGPQFARAASNAVEHQAKGVEEILRSQDGCLELAKDRREPHGMFAGNFYIFDATEAWRRFVVLALDRAMTAAVLNGSTATPCPSVVITLDNAGDERVVEVKGLPAESENVVGLPAKVTVTGGRAPRPPVPTMKIRPGRAPSP